MTSGSGPSGPGTEGEIRVGRTGTRDRRGRFEAKSVKEPSRVEEQWGAETVHGGGGGCRRERRGEG